MSGQASVPDDNMGRHAVGVPGQCHVPVGTVYRLDSESPSFSCRVLVFLYRELPDRWIGRKGPIPWAPRSPDLNPLDFFIWRFVRGIV